MKIDFFTTSINSPNILEKTYLNLQKHIKNCNLKECTLYLNIDPHPNNNNILKLEIIAKKFFGDVVINLPNKCNFTKAVNWCVSQIKTDVCFDLQCGKDIIKDFDIKKMYKDLINDNDAIQVSIRQAYSEKNSIYNHFLCEGAVLWKTGWIKKMYKLFPSTIINSEYAFREIALLDKKKSRKYSVSEFNFISLDYIGRIYKKNNDFTFVNSSTDNEIENIININGEWHKKVYDYYNNILDINKDKILYNFYLKTQDKPWIYRWTGVWKYIPKNKKKKCMRNTYSSSKYFCNIHSK